jgi:uncharacterized membrane protein YbhN (UPF0104 family)
MNPSVRQFLPIFSICSACALIPAAPIFKYLTHVKATAAMLLGILFVALGMHWLDRLNQQQRQISAAWLVLLFLILTAAFAVLYPISLKHTSSSVPLRSSSGFSMELPNARPSFDGYASAPNHTQVHVRYRSFHC